MSKKNLTKKSDGCSKFIGIKNHVTNIEGLTEILYEVFLKSSKRRFSPYEKYGEKFFTGNNIKLGQKYRWKMF